MIRERWRRFCRIADDPFTKGPFVGVLFGIVALGVMSLCLIAVIGYIVLAGKILGDVAVPPAIALLVAVAGWVLTMKEPK